jgi:excisionase family DNA binding protein
MIYTPRQAAEILGVDVSLVRKYLRDGVFPGAYKFRGTRWTIPHDDLMAVKNRKAKPMASLEKEIERRFCEYAKSKGCYPMKCNDPARRGANDRLVLVPGGKVAFVEFKRPGEEPRKDQIAYHQALWKMGFMSTVIDDVQEGETLINLLVDDI